MAERRPDVRLSEIAAQWGRLGCIGFGGPPAHIALLRRLCVEQRGWMDADEFEAGVAAVSLLPGPASTQLAIYCAWRLRGPVGALVGGVCFIVPGLAAIIVLAAVLLARRPAELVVAAAAGAGATVPIVALRAASSLVGSSWARVRARVAARSRWLVYALLGALAAALVGPWLVVVLLACGAIELVSSRPTATTRRTAVLAPLAAHALTLGTLGALAWVALKIGALAFGGGFVIVPLMQHDAVATYHWMTNAQFLAAVALGQLTPGPVVQTIAVVGYAAGGVPDALLAALIAFAPSFGFVLGGGSHFVRLRENRSAQAFLQGAGPVAIGAIAGSAVTLGLALEHLWQLGVVAIAAVWLLVLRRSIVAGILGGCALGALAVALGAPR